MTQMRAALRVNHLDARHEGDAGVGDLNDMLFIDGRVETGPSCMHV